MRNSSQPIITTNSYGVCYCFQQNRNLGDRGSLGAAVFSLVPFSFLLLYLWSKGIMMKAFAVVDPLPPLLAFLLLDTTLKFLLQHIFKWRLR